MKADIALQVMCILKKGRRNVGSELPIRTRSLINLKLVLCQDSGSKKPCFPKGTSGNAVCLQYISVKSNELRQYIVSVSSFPDRYFPFYVS